MQMQDSQVYICLFILLSCIRVLGCKVHNSLGEAATAGGQTISKRGGEFLMMMEVSQSDSLQCSYQATNAALQDKHFTSS